jgi:phosphate starvation-inducible PhoH-like protein
VPALLGAHDQNLAILEDGLDVTIMPRSEGLALVGQPEARDAARRALEDLYARLEQGLDVGTPEVRAAIRLAQDETGQTADKPVGVADSATHIITPRRHITARTPNQAKYLEAMAAHELVFGIGPAGTGKTYLAVAKAVQALTSGAVERIILTRPAVEAGERIGFLPGDMKEKVDPFLRPLYDALYDTLHGQQVERKLASGEIEIAPLAFMRGRTLSRAAIILDEAQNATPSQMKMFLTRLGEGARMCVTGDPTQADLPPGQPSGLREALNILDGIDGIAVVRFGEKDVVRHALVSRIVAAYDKAKPAQHGGETSTPS